jgi:hypothetical protein
LSGPRTAVEPEDPPEALSAELLTTLCCLFGAAVLMGAGYNIWDNIASNLHTIALFASLLCYVAAFALVVVGFARWRHAAAAVVAAVALAFVLNSAAYVVFKIPAYDSDAMLFNAYSAQLLLHGIDPYTQSMQPGYQIFGVAEGVSTPTLNGGEVYSLSYPALSFLVYVPFLLLGITNLLWVNLAAHLLVMCMLVRFAPTALKPLAPFVLFVDPTYFDYTVGGITDVLWIPAAMMTAVYWKRNPVAGGAWLGMACAFKQTPWVIVPFAAVHWLANARASRRSGDFLTPAAALAAAFAVPNLPFAIWHPQAWFTGATMPITGHLVAMGTGIAQLAGAGLVALSESNFTALTVLAFVTVLGLYIALPRRLAFLPFLAPALVFFFASRSLQNYFMYWPIVLMTYLFVNWKDDVAYLRRKKEPSSQTRAAAIVAACAVGIVPFAGRPAAATILVKIEGGTRSAITGRIDTLRIAVTSVAPRPVHVHFDVAEQGAQARVQAWKPRALQTIGPRETRNYTILAPSSDFALQSDGSTSTQVFVVDSEGGESYSPPVVFSGDAPHIHNADLALWSVGKRPFPIEWYFTDDDWSSGRIAKAAGLGRNAVALRVGPSPKRAWRATFLEQTIDARPGELDFKVYPNWDYRGEAKPARLFGIELRDAVRHEIYYTIDSRLHAAAVFAAPQGTIVALPGRLHAWNTIAVDLAALHARQGFVLASSGTMVVSVLAASDESSSGTAGYFGGARSIDTTLRQPQDALRQAQDDGPNGVTLSPSKRDKLRAPFDKLRVTGALVSRELRE